MWNVKLNPFTRPLVALRDLLGLKNDETPTGLFLPGVVPTLDITSIAIPESSVVSLTTTTQRLADTDCAAIVFQASPSNADNVQLGASAAAFSVILSAGQSFAVSCTNLNQWFASMDANTGDLGITLLRLT